MLVKYAWYNLNVAYPVPACALAYIYVVHFQEHNSYITYIRTNMSFCVYNRSSLYTCYFTYFIATMYYHVNKQ